MKRGNTFFGIFLFAFTCAVIIVYWAHTYLEIPNPLILPHVITQEDPVPQVLLSLRHQGKLVDTDENIRLDATSDYQSMIFTANMHSWETARLQLYIDLTQVKDDWVSRHNNTIVITVPASAIKVEAIRTNYHDEANNSWLFTLHSQAFSDLHNQNQRQLQQQLDAETGQLWKVDNVTVVQELGDMLSSLLKNNNFVIETKIDMNH